MLINYSEQHASFFIANSNSKSSMITVDILLEILGLLISVKCLKNIKNTSCFHDQIYSLLGDSPITRCFSTYIVKISMTIISPAPGDSENFLLHP